MPEVSGRKISVGIGKETTRGTAVSPAFWLQQDELSFQKRVKKEAHQGVIGVLDKQSFMDIVQEYADGAIGGNVLDRSFGLILLATLGSISTALKGGESVVYNHTITQNQSNTGQSLTIVRKDANGDLRYALATAKSLEIKMEQGQYVKFTFETVSKKGASATSTVSYSAENAFTSKHVTVKMASAVAGLGAATAIPVRSFTLKIDRDAEPYFVAGSNDVNEIISTGFQVSGEMVLRYTDTTYEALRDNDTDQAVSFTMANTDVTIGTSSNPTIVLTLPKVTLSEWDLDQSRDNVTEQTIGLTGNYSIADTKQIDAVVTNTTASY